MRRALFLAETKTSYTSPNPKVGALLVATGVLATAFAEEANRGTGRDELQLIAVSYGKGRVFNTLAGHDANAMSSVDWVVTFQRGTEWAATGAVTQKVPANFPTANTVSYRADLAAMDPGYKTGLNPLDSAGARGGR